MKCQKATLTQADGKTTFENEVVCEFETGKPKTLKFYGDEIQITAEECVGKTWDEIVEMKRKRDLAFLQS